MEKNKNFLYGIGSLAFDDFTMGYIEKGSFDFGGAKPESVDVEAEQVPDAPVLTLLQKNGQIAPSASISFSSTTRISRLCLVANLSVPNRITPAGRLLPTLSRSPASGQSTLCPAK